MNNHQWCTVILDKPRSKKECLGGYSHNCLSFVFVLMISKSLCVWGLLGIHPEKNMVRKDMFTPMFIEALFTTAKTWKWPQGPLTEEWIKKMWYIYTVEYCWAIKKNETMPFAATWKDLEIIMLSEVSWKWSKNICNILLHVKSKKKFYKWTYLQNRNLKNELMAVREEGQQRVKGEMSVLF